MEERGEFELYGYLPPEIQYRTALEYPYDTLKAFCQTSKGLRMGLCSDNAFWKAKTLYDFGDLYDIEEFDGNWRHNYEHYRTVFTLSLIEDLKKEDIEEVNRKMAVNHERRFLNPNMKNKEGWTALIRASEKGYEDIVRELLELGADPNIKEDEIIYEFEAEDNTALIFASNNGDVGVVRALLEFGADPSLVNGQDEVALDYASGNGHLEIVRLLLDYGANINRQRFSGHTALGSASGGGHLLVVQLLLEREADPNLIESYGFTPLIRGAYNADENSLEIVQALLQAGAEIDVQTEWGNTALIMASEKGRADVVQELLRVGADPNLINEGGQTALMTASMKGHTEIVEMLEEATTTPASLATLSRRALRREGREIPKYLK